MKIQVKKGTIKNIILIILIGVIACMFIFRKQISEEIIGSEIRVDTLEIQDKKLLAEVEEYKATIPALEATVDSLLDVVKADKRKIVEINNTLEEKIEIIKNNDVCEDMEFFGEYLGIRDTLPKLLRLEGKSVVIISKAQLKKANLTFVSHDAYVQEKPILEKNIRDYELVITTQQAKNDTLSVVVKKQDERIENNQEQIKELNKQVKFWKRKTTKRTIGGVLVGILIGGTAVAIFKN